MSTVKEVVAKQKGSKVTPLPNIVTKGKATEKSTVDENQKVNDESTSRKASLRKNLMEKISLKMINETILFVQ